MNIKYKKSKQKGIALVMSLIMLLVITMIGLASVRGSKIDTQAAGNSMFSLMVFQGAESALDQITSDGNIGALRIILDDRDTGIFVDVPESYYNPAEEMNDATLMTGAEMSYDDTIDASKLNEVISSDDSKYIVMRTKATTRLNQTGAKAVHVQGIAVPSLAQ